MDMTHRHVRAIRKCSGKGDTFSCRMNEENSLELDLREADLREIPGSVWKLEGLKVLKLCTDHIDSLHQSISMLEELEELYLHTSNYERKSTDDLLKSGVGLHQVPYFVTQLKRLRVLSVCGNPRVLTFLDVVVTSKPSSLIELELVKCGITKLPAPASCAKLQLHRLNLSGNSVNLSGLSELVDVTVMKRLNLSGCDLEEIPAEVDEMSNLEELFLSGNKEIETVSPSICRMLGRLRTFDLSHCDIKQLPVELSAMTVLEKLHLAHNKSLNCFPGSACSALAKMKVLDLSYCRIQQLPADLSTMTDLEELGLAGTCIPQIILNAVCAKLKKLKVLNLTDCNIQELPADLNVMNSLKELHLALNRNLHCFPASACVTLCSLQLLNLSYCAIRDLPQQLDALTNLEELRLADINCSEKLFESVCVTLTKLKVLDIGQCDIQQLPGELSAITGLEELGLSFNKSLKTLPASACASLTKLKVLKLWHCDIQELPAELSAMTCLEELDVSFNKSLQTLPASVCTSLTKLKVLKLEQCDFQELPAELSAMTCLEELDLSFNESLQTLPASVCTSLTKLKVLKLEQCDFQELPAGLSAMTCLEELDLSFNESLQTLPASVCTSLTKLKVLKLWHCDIQELPAELSAMTCLEKLDLSMNESLQTLPASVCTSLTKLKVLKLWHCDIQELPAELSAMTCLEKLDLSMNESLQTLPASVCTSLTKLKVLKLWHCDIQELPAELSAMTCLEELDVSFNESLQTLPASVCTRLTKLKVLNLGQCAFQELPAELSAMTCLEKLDLSFNESLQSLPAPACARLTKLQVLNLGHCDIQELPAELSAMTCLEKLDLSFNESLQSLPAPACARLTKLQVLNLGHCDIQELPAELSAMTCLEKLDLSLNKSLQTLPASACARLTKWKVLNLGQCAFQELPAELSAMTCLEKLDLSLNKSLQTLPASACARLTKLKVLNLGQCAFQELPAELSAMTCLEKLDLSLNKSLQTLPASACARLTKLKVLNLGQCAFQELPAELSAMTCLEKLDLSLNKSLQTLPASACARLTKLKVLNLGQCAFQELPAELSAMTCLEKLDLSLNKSLQTLPASACARLTKLKVLNLGQCAFQELPAELSAMTCLEKLDLSFNESLQTLPAPACARLTKLQVLNLGHCDIQELPAELSAMTCLEKLDLSLNKSLQTLPASACARLTKLKVLNLGQCAFQELPAELSAMTCLEKLDLSFNESLQTLPAPACARLTKLQVLNLGHCDIQELPAELSAMTRLEVLLVAFNTKIRSLPEAIFVNNRCTLQRVQATGCPLVCPPIAVYEGGVEAVREFFAALQTTVGIRRRRLKILVMGNTMAGKTSLVRAMSTGQPFLTETEDRTIGVEETTVCFSETVQCRVQDCGGHRAYMLTNQLMISDSALALIVVDISQYKLTEECFRENIGGYLEILCERNSKAYVIVVMSKVDQLSDSEHDVSTKIGNHVNICVGRYLNFRQMHVRQVENSLKSGDQSHNELYAENLRFLEAQRITVREDIVVTSSATYEGVRDLWSLLGQLCEDLDLIPSVEAQLPASWVAVEDYLVGETVPIVEVSDVVSASVSHGLTEEGTLHLLKYLHDVGSLLYFSRHAALRDIVFPSSAFVIDVFRAIFRHDHQSLRYENEHFIGQGMTRRQFNEMKEDLVNNATARIPMLLALWSNKFCASAGQYLEVFLSLFLSFDFAYLTASSDNVTRRLSEALRRRGLAIHGDRVFELGPSYIESSVTSSTRVSEDAEVEERGNERAPGNEKETGNKEGVENDLVSVLKQCNVGLLLPWLLNDEEPPEVKEFYTKSIERVTTHVSVKYSFAFNVPLGLFERLSARCHRHSNYIHHWRSGLLLKYGPVTLLMHCHRSPTSASISIHGKTQRSKYSCVRLWHVLLRCVADLEDLISTIPGVLVDGSVYDEASSDISGSDSSRELLQFRPGTNWLPFVKDLLCGVLTYSELKHPEAIEQGTKCLYMVTHDYAHVTVTLCFLVSLSLLGRVPLCQVLSDLSKTLVDEGLISDIVEDIGNSWRSIARKTGTNLSTISDIDRMFPDPSEAASAFLNHWLETQGKSVMVCELYDVLCDSGLSALAQRTFRYPMLPDAASGFVENPFAQMYILGSGPISSDVINIVADVGRDKWHEIGRAFRFSQEQLAEYDHGKLKERLCSIVSDWIRRDSNCSLRQLLEVCSKVGIKGVVTRKLREMSSQLS